MSNTAQQVANMIDMLPENDQHLAFETTFVVDFVYSLRDEVYFLVSIYFVFLFHNKFVTSFC